MSHGAGVYRDGEYQLEEGRDEIKPGGDHVVERGDVLLEHGHHLGLVLAIEGRLRKPREVARELLLEERDEARAVHLTHVRRTHVWAAGRRHGPTVRVHHVRRLKSMVAWWHMRQSVVASRARRTTQARPRRAMGARATARRAMGPAGTLARLRAYVRYT